jgi:hypothetical protein
MKKILTSLILLFVFISCDNKEERFSDEMIEDLIVLKENDDIPPPNSFIDIYVLTDNSEIMLTDNYSLYKLYNHYCYKKFKTLKEFLNEVLNKDFIIEKKFFKNQFYLKSFKLNRNIEKKYSDIGLDEFLKKYSEKTASNRTKLKKTIINENFANMPKAHIQYLILNAANLSHVEISKIMNKSVASVKNYFNLMSSIGTSTSISQPLCSFRM